MDGSKKGRQTQNNIMKVVKKKMSIKEVTKTMTSDIQEWRKRVHVVGPN